MTYEQIITAAGGRYVGVQDGYVYFDSPAGSTLAIAADDCTVEAVRAKLGVNLASEWDWRNFILSERL